jgi:hypothetical protein
MHWRYKLGSYCSDKQVWERQKELSMPAARNLMIVALVSLCGLTGPAMAQKGFSPAAQSGPVHLSLGYSGRLYIKVLDIQFDQTIEAKAFNSKVRLVTYGLLRTFRKLDMRANAQGRLVDDQPMPGTMYHANIDGKDNRKVSVTWTGEDVSTTATPTYSNMGNPPASRAQRLAAADPLTQFMRMTLARSQAGPCQGKARFYDGKQLYELDFSSPRPYALDARERRLGLVNPLRCNVRYTEVAGFKKKPPEQRNSGLKRPITSDWAQIGSNGPWVLSSLSADTPLGAAVIQLDRLAMRSEKP